MGWVVYDAERGDMEKYYRLERTAKSRVTRHNNEMRDRFFSWGPARQLAYCSYQDYEGILMGLRGDRFKLWQFCRQGLVDPSPK